MARVEKQVGRGKLVMEALIRWNGLKFFQKDKDLHKGHDANLDDFSTVLQFDILKWKCYYNRKKGFVLPTEGVPALNESKHVL